ncbi:MAG: alkaline phosphatase family protein, partial [Sphingomicrobium sp.]
MRSPWAALATAALVAPAAAIAQPAAPPPPKLIVAISVDQLSSDVFDRYRPALNGGFAKLGRGTVFPHAFQGHAATETCPGHSTILTGAYPARNGIIANTWYDLTQKRADKAVYCAEDERVAGSTSAAYTVSPRHLKV